MLCACCIIVGFFIQATVANTAVRYFAIFLGTVGGYTSSPLLLTWAQDNSSGLSVKAVTSAYCVSVGR